MKKLVNCTPHPINLIVPAGTKTLPPSGICPRVSEIETDVALAVGDDGIPIISLTFGQVTGLPEQEEGVLLIVSKMVADAASDRTDLVSPGRLVRDSKGLIIGCKALVRGAGMK